MLSNETGACYPTTKQIRHDLGLASLTIVFDAISALERHGFILRQRRNIEELHSRRNVYQRPSCEYTVLRLLEAGTIDGALRPSPAFADEMSAEATRMKHDWLRDVLGDAVAGYDAAPHAEKSTLLAEALRTRLGPSLLAGAR